MAHGSTWHVGYFHPLIFVSSREVVHCTVGGPCLKSRISLPVQRKELQTAVLLGEGFNPKPGKGKVSLPPRRDERLPSQQHMLPPPAPRSSTSKSLTFPIPVPYIPNSHTIESTPLSSVRQPIRLQVTSRQVCWVCFKFSQCQGRIIYISLTSPCTSGVMKEELRSSHLTANAYSNSEKLINFGSPKQSTEGFFYYYCCLGFQGVCFCKIWNSTKKKCKSWKETLPLFFFF